MADKTVKKNLNISSNVPAYFIDGQFFSKINDGIYNLNFMQKMSEDDKAINLNVVSAIRLSLAQIKDLHKVLDNFVNEAEKQKV